MGISMPTAALLHDDLGGGVLFPFFPRFPSTYNNEVHVRRLQEFYTAEGRSTFTITVLSTCVALYSENTIPCRIFKPDLMTPCPTSITRHQQFDQCACYTDNTAFGSMSTQMVDACIRTAMENQFHRTFAREALQKPILVPQFYPSVRPCVCHARVLFQNG